MVNSMSTGLQNSPVINIHVTAEPCEETDTQLLYIAICLENIEIRAATYWKSNCCFLNQDH